MLPVLTWKTRSAIENEHTNPPVKSTRTSLKENEVEDSEKDGEGERRFICTTCGKGFSTKGKLATHETFHEYSHEHVCLVCGETFSHMGKSFVCDQCGKAFGTQNHLTGHKRYSHTFQYSCRICKMQFVKKQECEKHEKTHPDPKKAIRRKSRKKGRKSKKGYSSEGDEEHDDVFASSPLDDEMMILRYKMKRMMRIHPCRRTCLGSGQTITNVPAFTNAGIALSITLLGDGCVIMFPRYTKRKANSSVRTAHPRS